MLMLTHHHLRAVRRDEDFGCYPVLVRLTPCLAALGLGRARIAGYELAVVVAVVRSKIVDASSLLEPVAHGVNLPSRAVPLHRLDALLQRRGLRNLHVMTRNCRNMHKTYHGGHGDVSLVHLGGVVELLDMRALLGIDRAYQN